MLPVDVYQVQAVGWRLGKLSTAPRQDLQGSTQKGQDWRLFLAARVFAGGNTGSAALLEYRHAHGGMSPLL